MIPALGQTTREGMGAITPATQLNGDSPPTENYTDYDVHGVVGIRVINCPLLEAAAIAKTFGPLQRSLSKMPDIVVRFVNALPPVQLQYLGLKQYAFSDETLFLLSAKTGAKAAIPLDQVGQTCEVKCENGMELAPLLATLINLTALTKGCVSLHASAFDYHGTGVLLTGWKDSGMTEALLTFTSHGGQYVGCDWILLKDGGKRMCGIPRPFLLNAWYLKDFPRIRKSIKLQRRVQIKIIAWLAAAQQRFPYRALDRLLPIRFLRDALPKLQRQHEIKVELQAIISAVPGPLEAVPNKVFLFVIHAEPEIQVEAIDPLELACRLTSSICHEQLELFQGYLAYKFAFPERIVPLMERAPELLEALLRLALAGKESYLVLHPDPVSMPALFESMLPFVKDAAKT
jgi:hypothetical protein